MRHGISIQSHRYGIVHIALWKGIRALCGSPIDGLTHGPATCKNCIRIIKAEAKKYEQNC